MSYRFTFAILFFALIFIAFYSKSAHASGRKDPFQRLEEMKTKLNLTEDQYQQIHKLITTQRETCAKEASIDARRACAEQGRFTTREKIAEILTPEQKERFKELRRSEGGNGDGGRQGFGRGQGRGGRRMFGGQ